MASPPESVEILYGGFCAGQPDTTNSGAADRRNLGRCRTPCPFPESREFRRSEGIEIVWVLVDEAVSMSNGYVRPSSLQKCLLRFVPVS